MFGQNSWSARVVAGHVDVHEVGGGEQHEADADHQTRVESLHQPRHERDQHQLRQAGPGQHHADLFGVVALDARQIDRQDDTPSRTGTRQAGSSRATPKPKLRRNSRRRFSNGFALVSSIQRNSDSATAAMTATAGR